MFTDSRKAQRNSYAHHRAHLLFGRPADITQVERLSALSGTDASALKQRVRAGLIGFVPKAIAPHIDRRVSNDA